MLRGSNFGGRLATAVDSFEQPVDATLRRQQPPLLEALVLAGIPGDENERSSKPHAWMIARRLSMLGETEPCSQRAITDRSRPVRWASSAWVSRLAASPPG